MLTVIFFFFFWRGRKIIIEGNVEVYRKEKKKEMEIVGAAVWVLIPKTSCTDLLSNWHCLD